MFLKMLPFSARYSFSNSVLIAFALISCIDAWQPTRPNRFGAMNILKHHNRNMLNQSQSKSWPESFASTLILQNIDQPSLLYIVQHLIDSISIEPNPNRSVGSILFCADQLKRLQLKFSHDLLGSVCLQYSGIKHHSNKRFEQYMIIHRSSSKSRAIDSVTGRLLCSVRLQQNVCFGPKAVRFAFYQSLNKRNSQPSSVGSTRERPRSLNSARHIWLSDDLIWLGVTLEPIGKVHTFNGWAILWRQKN